MTELRSYQLRGIEWLRERAHGILADPPGAGKTAQACRAIQTEAALVVCPASLLYNWAAELRLWRPDLTPVVIRKGSEVRAPRPGEVLIQTYGALIRRISRPTCSATIIADEAHALKNGGSARFWNFTDLRGAYRGIPHRVYGLTGTPLLNDPDETWSILRAIGCERIFRSYDRFRASFPDLDKTGNPSRAGRWGRPMRDFPARLAAVTLRRRQQDILPELPAQRWRVVEVEANQPGLKPLMDEGLSHLEMYEAMQRQTGVPLYKMPIVFQLARVRREMAAAKIPAMLELVDDLETQDEPVVVSSAHRAPPTVAAGRERWGLITGEVIPHIERMRRAEAFQAGGLRGMGITVQAGGEGLNLHRAAQMIEVDLDWVPAKNTQTEKRIHRIGQHRPCLYTLLMLNHPLDRRLAEVCREKEDLFEATITPIERSA